MNGEKNHYSVVSVKSGQQFSVAAYSLLECESKVPASMGKAIIKLSGKVLSVIKVI